MMGRMVHLLVAYDVSDARRRAKLHKLLKGYLWPSEESVFEGSLPEERWLEARARLLRLLKGEDRLLVSELCPQCWAKVRRYGAIQADIDAGILWISESNQTALNGQNKHETVAKKQGEA